MRDYALPVAILVAGLAIGAGLLFGNRYSSTTVANVLWRVDRLTGEVIQCWYVTAPNGGEPGCLLVSKPDLSRFGAPVGD